MYDMTKSRNLFADELTGWLLQASFIQYQCYMSIYNKYEPYGTIFFVLYYFDNCLYWYTSEALGKWFVDALGKIFHVKFLGYPNWFM